MAPAADVDLIEVRESTTWSTRRTSRSHSAASCLCPARPRWSPLTGSGRATGCSSAREASTRATASSPPTPLVRRRGRRGQRTSRRAAAAAHRSPSGTDRPDRSGRRRHPHPTSHWDQPIALQPTPTRIPTRRPSMRLTVLPTCSTVTVLAGAGHGVHQRADRPRDRGGTSRSTDRHRHPRPRRHDRPPGPDRQPHPPRRRQPRWRAGPGRDLYRGRTRRCRGRLATDPARVGCSAPLSATSAIATGLPSPAETGSTPAAVRRAPTPPTSRRSSPPTADHEPLVATAPRWAGRSADTTTSPWLSTNGPTTVGRHQGDGQRGHDDRGHGRPRQPPALQFSDDDLTDLVDEAHRHGLPVTAHAHSLPACVLDRREHRRSRPRHAIC